MPSHLYWEEVLVGGNVMSKGPAVLATGENLHSPMVSGRAILASFSSNFSPGWVLIMFSRSNCDSAAFFTVSMMRTSALKIANTIERRKHACKKLNRCAKGWKITWSVIRSFQFCPRVHRKIKGWTPVQNSVFSAKISEEHLFRSKK